MCEPEIEKRRQQVKSLWPELLTGYNPLKRPLCPAPSPALCWQCIPHQPLTGLVVTTLLRTPALKNTGEQHWTYAENLSFLFTITLFVAQPHRSGAKLAKSGQWI